MPEGPQRPPEPDPRRAAALGLVVTLLLILLGYFLARSLSNSARIQDCALSGRTNCAPIDSSNGGSQ